MTRTPSSRKKQKKTKKKQKRREKVLLYEFTFPAVKETSIGHVTE